MKTPPTEIREPSDVVFQQLHKDCGGELAVCASKSTIRIVCKRCRTAWDVYNHLSGFDVAIPAEWESYPGRGGAKVTTGHERTCKMRVASQGAAAIECEHGYDACPICDPCTCGFGVSRAPTHEEALAIFDARMAQRKKRGAK